MTADITELAEYRDAQLAVWPLARENYAALGRLECRRFQIGDFSGLFLHNPARIRSTGAAVDKKSVESRPCFLCAANRPPEQLHDEILPGWDFLVNPYPILPLHFTIVSTTHQPQSALPAESVVMAGKLPGMVIFFNGARAGASAPDHLHLQAVMASELPLLSLVEKHHDSSTPGIVDSAGFGLSLPFDFYSAVIAPDDILTLRRVIDAAGLDRETSKVDKGLVNTFVWIDSRGVLRAVVIPRSAHRPQCYFLSDDSKMVISPGALDMTGLVVVPRREDFERISTDDIRKIYEEVAWKSGEA